MQNNNIKYKFLVVGTGGTGTFFLKEFCRYLADNPIRKNITEIIIADGDIVEEHNLSRQAFLPEDVEQNKALVMTDIIYSNFNIKIDAYTDYITELTVLDSLLESESNCIPVIISCVDNHGFRLLLEDYYYNHSQENLIIMDAANEEVSGQCVFSAKLDNKYLNGVRSDYFPEMILEDERNVTEMSCEELNNSQPQHIFTNMTSALQLLSAVANLLERKQITLGVSYFNPFSHINSFQSHAEFPHDVLKKLKAKHLQSKLGGK